MKTNTNTKPKIVRVACCRCEIQGSLLISPFNPEPVSTDNKLPTVMPDGEPILCNHCLALSS